MTTASVKLIVATKQGISKEAWLRMHDEKNRGEGMKRKVEFLYDMPDNRFMVKVTYTARGADFSDLIHPYRESAEWRRLADVIRGGPTETEKHDD